VSYSLVTGGAGFIGRHLVRKLKERGERVRVFDLAPPKTPDDVQGSVTDENAARAVVEGVDTIFHLAGNAQLWARSVRVFDEVNRGGTEVMLAAAMAEGVQRFVHCSSLTTLVGRSTPLGASEANESQHFEPEDMLGPYPRSKLLAERAVMTSVAEGLDAVIAIPTEPLGPGDAGLTPPTRMILDFVNGRTPAYIDCMLNFVPVESLAEGLIAARDRGRRGQRYLLGGENISMPQLLDALARLTGREMPKAQLPYAIAHIAGLIDTGVVARFTGKPPKAPLTGVRLAGRRVSFSSEKALLELAWRAAPFEPALAEMLKWFESEGLVS
jgi:dihydroflavonol-4-reductase